MNRRHSSFTIVCLLVGVFFWSSSAWAWEVLREEGRADKPDVAFSIGGALRFNYTVKSWDSAEENRKLGGEILFDTFRLNTSFEYGIMSFDAEYRFYAGYHMLHHGYVALTPKECIEIQFGVMKAPFGVLPYSSNNWFFDVGYYLGLEDDYDAGIKAIWTRFDPLDVRFAFFLNSEGSYSGSSRDSARYSYDIVSMDPGDLSYAGLGYGSENRESNEGVLRIAYTFDHGELGETELGVSGRIGQIYNRQTGDFGSRWAAQLHIDSTIDNFNLQVGGTVYDHDPPNPEDVPTDVVTYGAYDAPYLVAASGTILFANLSYTFSFDRSVLDEIKVYNDYSVLLKRGVGFETTHQNLLGASIAAGPLFTYIDFGFAQNHPFLGPNYATSLAYGDAEEPWSLRFNINMGVYF